MGFARQRRRRGPRVSSGQSRTQHRPRCIRRDHGQWQQTRRPAQQVTGALRKPCASTGILGGPQSQRGQPEACGALPRQRLRCLVRRTRADRHCLCGGRNPVGNRRSQLVPAACMRSRQSQVRTARGTPRAARWPRALLDGVELRDAPVLTPVRASRRYVRSPGPDRSRHGAEAHGRSSAREHFVRRPN